MRKCSSEAMVGKKDLIIFLDMIVIKFIELKKRQTVIFNYCISMTRKKDLIPFV